MALGSGWRLGFLGVLHMEVFSQRLEQEYGASVVVTTPSVPYRLCIRESSQKRLGGQSIVIAKSPADWLESNIVESYMEPMVKGTIVVPHEYMSNIMSLCKNYRGEDQGSEFIDQQRLKMDWLLPLNEIVTDFFDELKLVTSGYGSFDYEDAGYRESSLVKMDVLLNGDAVPELATITHASRARERGKAIVQKLKDSLPRQQFQIAIQAAVGKNVVARENLQALRKDVTAKCYGGDLTRKMKLLKFQAEGKKKMMKSFGNIEVPKDTFLKLLSKKKD